MTDSYYFLSHEDHNTMRGLAERAVTFSSELERAEPMETFRAIIRNVQRIVVILDELSLTSATKSGTAQDHGVGLEGHLEDGDRIGRRGEELRAVRHEAGAQVQGDRVRRAIALAEAARARLRQARSRGRRRSRKAGR